MVAAVVTTKGREASLSILTTGFVPLGPVTMMLMKTGHNFQQETDTVADIAGDEIVATGYARQLVTFGALGTQTDGSLVQKTIPLSFGVVGGAVNDSVAGCYLFFDSGNDATSIVTACVTFVVGKLTDGTDLRVSAISLVWALPPF